ncbi:FAD-dependent oxidoreductase [Demequina pelophila]|uniref:FAD-dependent oxidoreductase n=1 Tax=Demequina pelophila TaxID=1638984 RepID=UPI00078396E9|nr:FAD-dependent oxidoreductase [Demequina pelophila]
MSAATVLVVGGGITGCVSAIALAQRGVEVTLVEKASDWHGVGHGITVQGNALKMFREIGVLDPILAKGHGFDRVRMREYTGEDIATITVARTGGPDLPATLGALRSDIQGVLVDKIKELGIELRLGTELVSFANIDSHVEAELSDGTVENYDVVIAADGIKSRARTLLGITEDKQPSGMGIWRAVLPRTPDMDISGLYYHGPQYKVGFTPISADLCYGYVLCDPVRPDNGLTDAQEMRRLMEGYGGHIEFLRSQITEDTYLNFQEIEWLFVEGPWHQGRVIAIGDAVHACPPLIAQGAAQCSEDAILLADYLTRDGDMERLLTEFEARRKPRVRLVVDASLQLVDWELHPAPDADPGGVMQRSLSSLAEAA